MKTLAVLSALGLPLFNIPLAWRVIQRKSSADISLVWAIGIWACTLGLLPSYLGSSDPILIFFGYLNGTLFSITAIIIIYYHPVLRKNSSNNNPGV